MKRPVPLPLPPPGLLMELFDCLCSNYGPLYWWPGETPFEVCVGAILTQNTNWGNVEKAIANLKGSGNLSLAAISSLPDEQLAELIRPAGYFNVKARRLKEFVGFVNKSADGDLEKLFSRDMEQLRAELLSVRGIGPETADSMLLYAGNHPSFVVDAYTGRIFSRLGLVPESTGYDQLREYFMASLSNESSLFNEYHALIVEHGKAVCRPRPRCEICLFSDRCLYSRTS